MDFFQIPILLLVFLLFLAVGGLVRFLLMKNVRRLTANRTCAGCGARLAADNSGALCSRCVSILSASQLGSDRPSGPMMPALGPQTAQGIQAGAPPPWGIQSPDAASTVAHAGRMPIPELPDLAARFPNLEILEPLGKGGMGAVYKARQTKLDRLVALKVLPTEFNRDPTFAERFLREARALARLNHPGIVAVHDFGEADGQPYFLMEFVEGADLRQVIRGGNLAADQALGIVSQICEALQFAHDDGIIHRDIKPENILLDKRGRVKIADFGLAKLLDPERIDRTLTATHQAMGTMNYMAPEQLDNAARVDHRADIYSLGVVFYEMLTGQVPRGKFDPPSHKAQVDSRLDPVVMRALESDPERRYPSVSELQTAVAAITQSGPPPLRNAPGATAPFLDSDIGTPSFQSAFHKIGLNLDVEAIKRQVEAPAIWLMVTGVLTVLIGLVAIADRATLNARWHVPLNPVDYLWVISSVLGFPAGFFIILGSRKMHHLEFFAMARLSCILAMLPLGPAALLGIPIGIWSLMILLQPRIQSVFRTDADSVALPPAPEPVRRMLAAPRLALMCSSVLWVVCGTGSVVAGLALQIGAFGAPFVLEALGIANLLIATFMIIASRSMATCQGYGLARLGCMLALLPLSPAVVVTFPIGLRALSLLKKPAVRQAFGLPVSEAEWQEDDTLTQAGTQSPWRRVFGFVLVIGFALAGWLSGVLLGAWNAPRSSWFVFAVEYGLPGMLVGLVLGPLLYGVYLEARKILRRGAENDAQVRQNDRSTNRQ